MFIQPKLFTINEITTQTVLNWLLPALGIIAGIFVIWFVWRYLRHSNEAGRISEFNERTFKKLISDEVEQEHHPVCEKCKMLMRVEIRYKDFMKDQGDFLIHRDTAEHTLESLVNSGRITKNDMKTILQFFIDNPKINEQTFKRYRCVNCNKIEVLPYILNSSK
ncbi:MAG: hypothetical protein JXA54_13960 [Candidatus Heimdallarchaeota archaeon]|nr:hypothetical protein [Candidatus Heimdallarchaeota archaeon]